MSLLKKLTGLSSHQPQPADTERRYNVEEGLFKDDGEFLNLVDVHWNNARQIMALDDKTIGPNERSKILVYHLSEIVSVIVDEREGDPGPCLQYVLDEDIFHVVYSWSANFKPCMKEMKKEQLRLFRNLIERARTPLLIYEQVWKPLLFLLHSCTIKVTPDMEEDFVAVLKGLCVSVNRDIALLDLFFLDNHPNSQIAKLSVFSLLIAYVHRDGDVGVWARDAMLLCMALSSVNEKLGSYIAEETNFCPVLATGLSGLYSSLPSRLDIPSDDWYSLERGLWATFPELVAFLTSLEFCNNVIQIAHFKVQVKLLEMIYDGFLVSVMAPALNQSATDALIATTAYLDLFLRSITDSNLMKVFVKFILTATVDGLSVLDTMISRISHESQLAVVCLGFFHTILDLNCEDIVYQLVLKFLIPCSHILTSQKRTVNEVDFYSKSALKFLSLTPSCCEGYHPPGTPLSPCSSNESLSKSTEKIKIDMKGCSDLVFYQSHLQPHLYTDLAKDYMDYLADARVAIRDCRLRCLCWSHLYNGEDPPCTEVTSDRYRSPSSNSVSALNGHLPNRSNSDISANLKVSNELPTCRSRSTTDFERNKSEVDLGYFIKTLFQKLENMPQNSFYVNIVLTGVLTRLAHYPQPLLKSLLLNYNMVLKPGVRSLFQTLSSIKIRVENTVNQVDGAAKLLRRARRNLMKREEKSKQSIRNVAAEPRTFEPFGHFHLHAAPSSPKLLTRQKTDSSLLQGIKLLQDGPPPRAFGRPLMKRSMTVGTTSPRSSSSLSLSSSSDSESFGSESPLFGSTADVNDEEPAKAEPVKNTNLKNQVQAKWSPVNTPGKVFKNTYKRKSTKGVKNAIYCAVVMEEWLKELAAISQEHTLTPCADIDLNGFSPGS